MSAQNQISAAVNDAREQWRANSRLRYGVYVIVGVMWLYCILGLRDSVTAKREAWTSAEARIARARVLANSGDWVSRANDVKSAMTDYESLIWKEGSLGLAQAAIQESLNRTLASAGLIVRQIKVAVGDAPLAAEMAEIVPIRARVLVDFRPAAVNSWLAGIARDVSDKKPAIMIESLTIRGAPTPFAEIEMVAYALRPEAVAASNNAKAGSSNTGGAK